jgi:hypothetical protein
MLINNISFTSFSYVTFVILSNLITGCASYVPAGRNTSSDVQVQTASHFQNSFIADELLQGTSDQVMNEHLVPILNQRFPGNKY